MKRKYFVAIVLAAGVLLASQIFIQYWLASKKYDANSINLSGRQRMLSQRINLAAYQFAYGDGSKSKLAELFQQWEQTHHALLNGDAELELQAIPEGEIRNQLQALSPRVAYIGTLIDSDSPIGTAELRSIDENQNAFLQSMDQVVKKLENSSESRLNFIIIAEIFLFLLSLLLLIGEIQFIFIPINKRLEATLSQARKHRQVLNAINQSARYAITFIDKNLKVQYVNRRAQELTQNNFGRSMEVGDLLESYISGPSPSKALQRYQKALAGAAIEYEQKIGASWWKINLFPVYDKKGATIGFAQNAYDISEVRELKSDMNEVERRMEVIARNFPNGTISLVSQELEILYTNGEAYHRSGIDHRQWQNQYLQELLHPAAFAELQGRLVRISEGHHTEFQVREGDRHTLYRVQPVTNEQGEASHFVLISNDITELIRQQEELMLRNQQLQEISWAQSHELRGPLASIMGLREIMLAECDSEVAKTYLELMAQSCNKLDAAIHRIVGLTQSPSFSPTS